MLVLGADVKRCPQCNIAEPNLQPLQNETNGRLQWALYRCASCRQWVMVRAVLGQNGGYIGHEFWPETQTVSDAIPARARTYLDQALASTHAPAGAMMLAASAIDAMLQAKGYATGSLYSRINKAAEDHLITADMKDWAHEVRLDANDQRHSDEEAPLPTADHATQAVTFTKALGQFLFVLPAMVKARRAEPA